MSKKNVVDKLNKIKEQQVPLDDNIINSAILANSGATCRFMEIYASCIKNIQMADPGINSLRPNGKFMKSTHFADLNYPNLPQDSAASHIFPHLASGSLISIGKFCDTGCNIHMDTRTFAITQHGNTVLTGTQEPGDIWYVYKLTESNALFDPIVSTSTHTCNELLPTNLLNEKLKFLHATMGHPVLSTF